MHLFIESVGVDEAKLESEYGLSGEFGDDFVGVELL